MAAALIISLCAGFGYAWSVLQAPIIEIHGWSDSSVSLAYTLTVVCSTLTSLCLGAFIRKMGTKKSVLLGSVLFGGGLFLTGVMTSLWQLYFFYAVLTGVGTGLIYPVLMAYVVKLFPEKPGLASGLGTAFYGAGAMLWAPTAAGIIEGVSFKAACMILGGGFFVIIAALSFLIKDPTEAFIEAMSRKVQPDDDAEEEKFSESENELSADDNFRRYEMVRTKTFYLTAATFALGLIAGVIVISQASPIMQRQFGMEPVAAATFVSVFSACNMAGRFGWGAVSDKTGIRKAVLYVFAVCILSMALISIVKNDLVGIVALCLAASCYGGLASMLTPFTAQLFGSKYITENYGVMYLVFGVASLVGPLLASGIYSGMGSYTMAFVLAGVLAVIGQMISLFIKKPVKNAGSGRLKNYIKRKSK